MTALLALQGLCPTSSLVLADVLDQTVSADSLAARSASPILEQHTLTDDWFGKGQALRDAGFDFRFEWSQFYQGMTKATGDKSWQYGGKSDPQVRIDLSKFKPVEPL